MNLLCSWGKSEHLSQQFRSPQIAQYKCHNLVLIIPSIIAGMITPLRTIETRQHSITPVGLRCLCSYTTTVSTLGTEICQIYNNHNINNAARSYLPFYIFHNFNILNNLVHCNVFPEFKYWCLNSNVFETPWGWHLGATTYDMTYLLTAIGLTHGNSTAHIYKQTMHRTTQWDKIFRTEHTLQ
jgi:hypothetical protein